MGSHFDPALRRYTSVDRYLVSLAVFALILELTWLAGDFNLIHLPYLSPAKEDTQRLQAGHVEQARREVRKKASDSLVWETPGEREAVFFNDSFLTLAQSSATLSLQGGSQLHLAENTLVVIEPSSDEAPDRIRLRFSKGAIRSHSGEKTRIQTDSWVIEAEKGSELKVRQVEGEKIQVEMSSGRARVLHGEDNETNVELKANEILTVDEEKVLESQTVTQDLLWQDRTPARIYSHSFPVEIDLEWSGPAEEIEIWSTTGEKRTVSVEEGTHKRTVALNSGTFFLRLSRNETVSATREVEIWNAPVLHLFSPLPRDRAEVERSLSFSWAESPLAKEYRLQVSRDTRFEQIIFDRKMQGIEAQAAFDDGEGKYHWRVMGYDESGYPIPALYSYPLYFSEEPLPAPKLIVPENRSPADVKKKSDDQSFFRWRRPLIGWLIGTAWAQEGAVAEKVDLVFRWEKVEGASAYIIEISETPDFRTPLLIEKTEGTEFRWKNVEPKIYYWRVAGEGGSGRKGLFSPVSRLDVSELPVSGAAVDGVAVQAPPAPAAPSKTTAQKKDGAKNEEASPVAQQKIRIFDEPGGISGEKKWKAQILWMPSYYSETYKSAEDVDASLSGFLAGVVGWDIGVHFSDSFQLQWIGQFAKTVWREKEELPFQEDLRDERLSSHLFWRRPYSRWLWGVYYTAKSGIGRADLEEVSLKTASLAGPSVRFENRISRYYDFHTLSLGAGDGIWSVHFENDLVSKYRWAHVTFTAGLRLALSYFSGSEGRSGLSMHPGLILGMGF